MICSKYSKTAVLPNLLQNACFSLESVLCLKILHDLIISLLIANLKTCLNDLCLPVVYSSYLYSRWALHHYLMLTHTHTGQPATSLGTTVETPLHVNHLLTEFKFSFPHKFYVNIFEHDALTSFDMPNLVIDIASGE